MFALSGVVLLPLALPGKAPALAGLWLVVRHLLLI